MLKTCKDCKHWFKVEQMEPGVIMHDAHKPGDCRQGPPGVIFAWGKTATGDLVPIGMQSHYPRLRPSFPACDQFQPREEAS